LGDETRAGREVHDAMEVERAVEDEAEGRHGVEQVHETGGGDGAVEQEVYRDDGLGGNLLFDIDEDGEEDC
jgi:hypothetical protein